MGFEVGVFEQFLRPVLFRLGEASQDTDGHDLHGGYLRPERVVQATPVGGDHLFGVVDLLVALLADEDAAVDEGFLFERRQFADCELHAALFAQFAFGAGTAHEFLRKARKHVLPMKLSLESRCHGCISLEI